jgi:hypothetical protein
MSGIRLRPRPPEPERRRSYRIVSRGSADSPQPSIIRITRSPEQMALTQVSPPPSSSMNRRMIRVVPRAQRSEAPSLEQSSGDQPDSPPIEIVNLINSPYPRRPTESSPVSISSASSHMSLSSRDSYEDTLSSDDEESLDDDHVEDEQDRRVYESFIRSILEGRSRPPNQAELLLSTADAARQVSEPQHRPEIIDVLKIHTGLSSCAVCRSRIVRGDILVDYRPRTPAAVIRHCHFGCIDDNTDLYFPTHAELIRFDPQFSPAEVTSLLEQLRRRLPGELDDSRVVRLHALVRPGDPDRRISRQRDFINQELASRSTLSYRARQAIEQSRYMNSRRSAMDRLLHGVSDSWHFPRGGVQSMRTGLALGILHSLPRFVLQASTEESANDEDSCVVCLETMDHGQKIVILPCLHRFHAECIDSWLQGSKLCPIDKLDIEQLVHRSGHSQSHT